MVWHAIVTGGKEDDQGGEWMKYKKVANKTKPVVTTLPEEFCIVWQSPEEPLKDLAPLPVSPPTFVPTGRYTQERFKVMEINPDSFMWPEEEKLAHKVIHLNKKNFALDESEKGVFKDEYYDLVVMPTIEHIPYSERNIPIPPGIKNKVISYIKDKIVLGVYESSNSSYRSSWFCVPKKNSKIFLVHNLQPLNRITIKDAAVPPLTDHME